MAPKTETVRSGGWRMTERDRNNPQPAQDTSSLQTQHVWTQAVAEARTFSASLNDERLSAPQAPFQSAGYRCLYALFSHLAPRPPSPQKKNRERNSAALKVIRLLGSLWPARVRPPHSKAGTLQVVVSKARQIPPVWLTGSQGAPFREPTPLPPRVARPRTPVFTSLPPSPRLSTLRILSPTPERTETR